MDTPQPLRAVVGRRLRALREGAGLRQQDIADALGQVGVTWMPTRVAAVERGDKAIGLEDLVLLAAAMQRAADRPTSVVDLIEPSIEVELHAGAHVRGEDLIATLGGAPAGDLVTVSAGQSAAERRDPVAQQLGEHFGWPARGTVWGRARYVEKRGFGEPDTRAARQLGIPAPAFAVVCEQLWGRSLTAERDRRLAEDLDLGTAEGPTVAARRGRVSRTLLGEAREVLHDAGVVVVERA